MDSNVHRTWDYQGTTMYTFSLTFEDGTTGQGSSKKQQPTWRVGSEYEFTVVKNGNYTNIKGMKPANQTFQRGGKSPEDAKKIIRQSCLKAAVESCNNPAIDTGELTTDSVLSIAAKYEQWVNR